MNKGIIMEKHRHYNIVLTHDGSFKKVKIAHEDNLIGEEIKFEPYISKSFFKKDIQLPAIMKLGSIAALIAIFVFFCFSFVGGNKTYAYITVDVNPSIEIEVDDLLRVQNISALNEDAEILLQELPKSQHENLELVIEEIIYKSEKLNMSNEEKNMLIGVSYINESERKIIKNINQHFNHKSTDWEIITFNVPQEVRQKAVENQTSMNEQFANLIGDKNNRFKDKIKIDEEQRNHIKSFYNISSENKNEELKIKEKTESDRQGKEKKEQTDRSSSIKTKTYKTTTKISDNNSGLNNTNSKINWNSQSENIEEKAKDKAKTKASKTEKNEQKKVEPKYKKQQGNQGVSGNQEKNSKEHHKKNSDKESQHKNVEKKHKKHEKHYKKDNKSKNHKAKDKSSKENHGKSKKEKERNPR